MRTPVCIQDYVDLLSTGFRFVQANYGDGEWACILGHDGANCNGEHYSKPLQKALQDTLHNPPHGHVWYGSNPGKKLQDIVSSWLVGEGISQRAWVYKEIISGANVNGKLHDFIGACRTLGPIIVGPKHLRKPEINDLFNSRGFVAVPDKDAYLAIERTTKDTCKFIEETEASLVLVCSGMASNPLIFDLARKYDHLTLIDMGACLDPYVANYSRSGYRKDEFKNVAIKMNTEGFVCND